MQERYGYSIVLEGRHSRGFACEFKPVNTDSLWNRDTYIGFCALTLVRSTFERADYLFDASGHLLQITVVDGSGERAWDPVNNQDQASQVLGYSASDEKAERKTQIYSLIHDQHPQTVVVPFLSDPL
ncbi:hypothetical protein SAMN05216588_101220 [Pseudomonas flavescens]|uniref:Uncharacterized protein n=1 Tax=Phytopseudomonas flavescens TaxID=29435 RepID=A0A1G7XPP9_9GAMM|nr:hypothetical protein SAMN05216588_101220 [Pseudomonas flavescens]